MKNNEDNHSMRTKGGSGGEPGSRSGQEDAPLDGQNLSETLALRSAENKKVEEDQESLNNRSNKSGEPDYAHKSNGNPDSQVYGNGDGDLPSFSIKRLRRLPHRVSPDNHPSTLAFRTEPTDVLMDQNCVDDDKEAKLGVGESMTDTTLGRKLEAGFVCPLSLQAEETTEQVQALSDSSLVDAAHFSGDSARTPELISRISDTFSSKDEIVGTSEGSLEVPEEGTSSSDSPGAQNRKIEGSELEVEHSKFGYDGTELRNPNSGESDRAGESLISDLSDERDTNDLSVERKEYAEPALDQERSGENKHAFASSEHASDNTNPLGEIERWRTVFPSYVPNFNVEHSAFGLQADDYGQEDQAPGNSDILSSSAGLGSMSEKSCVDVDLAATPMEDLTPDGRAENGAFLDAGTTAESTHSAEIPAPGVVQILAPVIGSRFEHPGETTDEEIDSPRSSEGFAYPDSDATTLLYSGQVMHPGRYSYGQSQNGPSILQYSGSMSLRSDSSTTSNRSFVFPILAPPDYNSSPVRMAKPDPRYLKKKNRISGCCFFRLCRSRHKY